MNLYSYTKIRSKYTPTFSFLPHLFWEFGKLRKHMRAYREEGMEEGGYVVRVMKYDEDVPEPLGTS